MNRLTGFLHGMSGQILDALYPPHCIVCGRSDRMAGGIEGFCLPCLSRLPMRRPPDRLLFCSAVDPGSERFPVIAATYYDETLRRLIARFKFHREAGYHMALSSLALHALRAEYGASDSLPDAVVAVPLHARRLRERGYNQAGLLAADLADALRIRDLSGAVERVCATPRQTESPDRRIRYANLENSFSVTDPLAVRGRHIVLVDDVMTSGATLYSCGRSLLRFSPARVTGIVVSSGRPAGTM